MTSEHGQALRDAALTALSAVLPAGITIVGRGSIGWTTTARRGRFERASVSSYGTDWRPGGQTESEFATVLRRQIADICEAMATVGLPWPGLAPGRIEVKVTDDAHWVRVTLTDTAGRHIRLAPIANVPLTPLEHLAASQALGELSRLQASQPARSWADTVLAHLVRLCLEEDGQLDNDVIVLATLRLGAFCDLVFAGRLTNGPTGWELDTEPTGFAPVDALLAEVTRHPDRPLSTWVGSGPPLQGPVVAELITSGRWRQRARSVRHPGRRYADVADPTGVGTIAVRRELRAMIEDPPVNTSAGLAALAACACLADLIDPGDDEPPAALLALCADARPLLDGAYDLLCDLRRRQQWTEAMRAANPPTNPGW